MWPFLRDGVLGLVVCFVASGMLGAIVGGEGPWVMIGVFIPTSLLWVVWACHHHREFLRSHWQETIERQQRYESTIYKWLDLAGEERRRRDKGVPITRQLRSTKAHEGHKLQVISSVIEMTHNALGRQKGAGLSSWASRASQWVTEKAEASKRVHLESEEQRGEIATLKLPKEFREQAPQASSDLTTPISVPLVDWQVQLMGRVQGLEPGAFERLACDLLRRHGLTRVEVTGGTGDGGIDGIGYLRTLRQTFPVYFQCKRYQGSVGPSQVRDFRGAMEGRFGHGIFITSGSFSVSARGEATRQATRPIELIDGDDLIKLMREHRLGLVLDADERQVLRIDDDYFRRLARW